MWNKEEKKKSNNSNLKQLRPRQSLNINFTKPIISKFDNHKINNKLFLNCYFILFFYLFKTRKKKNPLFIVSIQIVHDIYIYIYFVYVASNNIIIY